MKRINSGFSLAEVIIVMAIIGAIAMILMPMFGNLRSNKEQVMLKKAYAIIDRIVAEVKDDEDFYTGLDDNHKGFSETKSIVYHGRVYGKDPYKKFCELFAEKMNEREGVSCDNHSVTSSMQKGKPASGKTLTSPDGMIWIIPYTNFADNNYPSIIYVDVNGDKKPNCFSYYSEIAPSELKCEKTEGPDRFAIRITEKGGVEAKDKLLDIYLRRNDTGKTYKEVRRIEKLD